MHFYKIYFSIIAYLVIISFDQVAAGAAGTNTRTTNAAAGTNATALVASVKKALEHTSDTLNATNKNSETKAAVNAISSNNNNVGLNAIGLQIANSAKKAGEAIAAAAAAKQTPK